MKEKNFFINLIHERQHVTAGNRYTTDARWIILVWEKEMLRTLSIWDQI